MNKSEWSDRGPWVVQDSIYKREWLSVEPMRYYIAECKQGFSIVDRHLDLPATGKHPTRNSAIRAFYKKFGRPIRAGEKLEDYEGSKFI